MKRLYQGRCFTCRHWRGDKVAQRVEIDKDSTCMNLGGASADTWGRCGQEFEGFAFSGTESCYYLPDVEFPGWFGCVLHQEDEES